MLKFMTDGSLGIDNEADWELLKKIAPVIVSKFVGDSGIDSKPEQTNGKAPPGSSTKTDSKASGEVPARSSPRCTAADMRVLRAAKTLLEVGDTGIGTTALAKAAGIGRKGISGPMRGLRTRGKNILTGASPDDICTTEDVAHGDSIYRPGPRLKELLEYLLTMFKLTEKDLNPAPVGAE